METKDRKIFVNIGIPYKKLRWIDSVRGNDSRSNYVGKILLPVIDERIAAAEETSLPA